MNQESIFTFPESFMTGSSVYLVTPDTLETQQLLTLLESSCSLSRPATETRVGGTAQDCAANNHPLKSVFRPEQRGRGQHNSLQFVTTRSDLQSPIVSVDFPSIANTYVILLMR